MELDRLGRNEERFRDLSRRQAPPGEVGDAAFERDQRGSGGGDQIDWLEGFLGTVSYQALTVSSYFPRRPSQFGGGARGSVLAAAGYLFAALSFGAWRVLAAADLRYRITDTGFPKNYTVIATKPA